MAIADFSAGLFGGDGIKNSMMIVKAIATQQSSLNAMNLARANQITDNNFLQQVIGVTGQISPTGDTGSTAPSGTTAPTQPQTNTTTGGILPV